ncbi:hypothetical protein DPMN_039130 [Dreissena polymorpha]|uniref:Uncharacterized protein n=1 Tax=Dreissena polymorpha TaxID=45954 RepID=A0A9D4RRC6_DREPO|nr:hypothetical protein DPMN_039130 [Dreissena polymorpha]
MNNGLTKNVRVLTNFHFSNIRKNAPLIRDHALKRFETSFELLHIIKTNILTTFHEDWTIYIYIYMITQSLRFSFNLTSFKLGKDTIETNLMTKFHEVQN